MKFTLSLICLLVLSACSYTGTGVDNPVTVKADAAWERQPEQLDALMQRVRREWNRNVTIDWVRPPAGTTVSITIRIYSDGGEAAPLSIIGGSKKAQRACARALMKSSRKWTPEMIRDLGTEQVLTFTFVYS